MFIKFKKYKSLFRETLVSVVIGVFLFYFWTRVHSEHSRISDNVKTLKQPLGEIKQKFAPCALQQNESTLNQHLFNIDRSKFLLPLLTNGPNNQLIGFRDAIFLSIIINRTLVIPKFYKHKSSEQIEASLRVNLRTLSRLIPIISETEMNERCNGKIDGLFLTDRSSWMASKGAPYHHLADLTGIPSLHKTSEKETPCYPNNNLLLSDLDSDSTTLLRSIYPSDKKCVLYVYPYRSVGVRESATKIRKAKSLLKSPFLTNNLLDFPVLIYSLGYVSTPLPDFLFKIAEQFRTQNLQNRTLIAVHWRFDKNDWMIRCPKQKPGDGKVYEMCAKMEKIGAKDVAIGIEEFRRKLTKSGTENPIVYVAAPLTISSFVDEIKSRLVASGIQTYSYSDARNYLDKHSGCSFIKEHFFDLLSLLEMNICLYSHIFLSSDTSSWSSNIIRDRIANKQNMLDKDILDIAWRGYELNIQ